MWRGEFQLCVGDGVLILHYSEKMGTRLQNGGNHATLV